MSGDRHRARAIEKFLAENPNLTRMREHYPEDWEQVRGEISAVLSVGHRKDLDGTGISVGDASSAAR